MFRSRFSICAQFLTGFVLLSLLTRCVFLVLSAHSIDPSLWTLLRVLATGMIVSTPATPS